MRKKNKGGGGGWRRGVEEGGGIIKLILKAFKTFCVFLCNRHSMTAAILKS